MSNQFAYLESLLLADTRRSISKLVWLEEVDSTQSYLKRQVNCLEAKTPDSIYVCLADSQTAGRGQRDQNWQSYPGQIYWSIAFPITHFANWQGLSLASAVEVQSVLSYDVSGVKIKWPNDIVCSSGKLGGILIESARDQQQGNWLIMGLGLNINQNPQLSSQKTQCLSNLVKNQSIDRMGLCARFMEAWVRLIDIYPLRQFAEWQDAFEQVDDLYGQTLKIELGGQIYEGQARGVNDKGQLKLYLSDGECKLFSNGTIKKIRGNLS